MEFAFPKILDHTVDFKTHFWMENSHYTDCWHLILVEQGSFSYSMLNQKDEASEYEAVLFPLNVEFSRKITKDVKIHYFGIEFNKDDNWLKENGQFFFGKLPLEKELVKNICRFCGEYFENEYLPIKDSAIKFMWSNLLGPTIKNTVSTPRVITNNSVANAVEFMNLNLKEKISIEELAKNLGYTHIQFTRLFSKEMGKPPVVYLNELRLNKAKRLLGETDMSVCDIALECGFENQFYLHNRFKKMYGLAPSVYRKHTGK